MASESALLSTRDSSQLGSTEDTTAYRLILCSPKNIRYSLLSFASLTSIVRTYANVANKYMTDVFYEEMRSSTDHTSYLIRHLEALKRWGALSSLVLSAVIVVLSHQGTPEAHVGDVSVSKNP